MRRPLAVAGLPHQGDVPAELAGAGTEGVGGFDFVGLFAAQREGDLPVVDLVLGEVVEVVKVATVHVAFPVFVVVVGLEDHRAPPVEDLEFAVPKTRNLQCPRRHHGITPLPFHAPVRGCSPPSLRAALAGKRVVAQS